MSRWNVRTSREVPLALFREQGRGVQGGTKRRAHADS